MDGRGVLIDIYKYQRGKWCEYTYANNDFEDITYISLTPGYTGGGDAFVKKRNSIITNM